MSFFSRSRSRGHYPSHGHGSGYYKRSHGIGGILGKFFDILKGSGRHSQSHAGHHDGYSQNRHHRKGSWS